MSVRRPVLAGWRWSALVGRRGVVSGPGRECGPGVNTNPERLAATAGPGAATATALGSVRCSRRRPRLWGLPRSAAVGWPSPGRSIQPSGMNHYGCARAPFWTEFLPPRLNLWPSGVRALPLTRLDVLRSLSHATPFGSGGGGPRRRHLQGLHEDVNGARILTPFRQAGSTARRNTPAIRRGVEMGRRGRKRRLGVEDEYWRLTLSGVGTVEACRLLRIGRKTGYRWRAERGGLPPLRVVEAVRGPRYLPGSSASGSRRCVRKVWASGRSRSGWIDHRRRSAVSCDATEGRMTATATTAT